MSGTVVRCQDCRNENDRPKLFRFTCHDCCDDFVARHAAQFPHHKLEVSGWNPEVALDMDRGTQRLTQRKVGW